MMFDKVTLEVVYENAALLADSQYTDPTAFALIRRNGFGASDAATLLEVSPFNTLTDLIKQKASAEITDEELKIGQLASVRMGRDLESFILAEFEKWSGMLVKKPEAMYKIVEFPQLTVNFDGLTTEDIPVEIKVVTQWGEKYWSHDKAMKDIDDVPVIMARPMDRVTTDTIKALAADCGVPIYYYTQCQQQMLAANAEYAYLGVMHVKDWTFRCYYIPRNEQVIMKLKEAAYINWKKVQNLKH